MISEMTLVLREQLMAVRPDVDPLWNQALRLRRHRHRQPEHREAGAHQRGDLRLDADWGHQEAQGGDARTGAAWVKIKRWFGYGLNLLADTR